ncbi:MAG: EAL domain-containing protein [Pseudomonadota bacterium]
MTNLRSDLFSSRLDETPSSPRLRFERVVHLQTGEAMGAIAETYQRFEERAVFGPAVQAAERACPADWLGARVEEAALYAETADLSARPIHVPAPIAALAHSSTPQKCESAIRRTRLCPQEVVVEFEDAAFASAPNETSHHIQSLRRRGFRVGIDARRSWTSDWSGTMMLMIDAIRVDMRSLECDPDLEEKVADAAALGVYVIVDQPKWRDADQLAEMGAICGVRARADA